jgi:hypothetical protein
MMIYPDGGTTDWLVEPGSFVGRISNDTFPRRTVGVGRLRNFYVICVRRLQDQTGCFRQGTARAPGGRGGMEQTGVWVVLLVCSFLLRLCGVVPFQIHGGASSCWPCNMLMRG